MRTYWSLDPRTQLALTEKELMETYIPREVAAAGLLVPKPPILQELPPKPDLTPPAIVDLFGVEYFYREDHSYSDGVFDAVFKTMKEAMAFIAMKPIVNNDTYSRGTRKARVKQAVRYSVYIVHTTNEVEQEIYDKAMAQYNEIESENSSLQSKYASEMAAIEKQASTIRGHHSRLQQRRLKLEQTIETLKEFMTVAEGNFSIALGFLRKNNSLDAQTIYDALNEIDNDFEWDVNDHFGGDCLKLDNNPYRDVKGSLF